MKIQITIMQGTELRGTKLRGSQIIQIVKHDLETNILEVKREPEDSFEFVQIETSRGRVDCKYYKAGEADTGVIMVGGVGGDFETPANNLYPRLCDYFKGVGIVL